MQHLDRDVNQRAERAKEYAKEVLRGLDLAKVDRELQVFMAQIIIHAYLRGQTDLQAELAGPSN